MEQKSHNTCINREISWLDFNARVLEEAFFEAKPILDRAKFLAIFSSNLDEFFMVRVAGLRQQLEKSPSRVDPAGLSPREQLDTIQTKLRKLLAKQYDCLNQNILPELAKKGMNLIKLEALNETERKLLRKRFEADYFPVLTPVAVDSSHPFPVLANRALEIAVRLKKPDDNEECYAFVEVPTVLSRFVPVETDKQNKRAFVLLEDLVIDNIDMLFSQCDILETLPFRVTRDMDFNVDDEEVADLLSHMEKQLLRTRRRDPIRMEYVSQEPGQLLDWLRDQFNLNSFSLYALDGLLDLTCLFELCEVADIPNGFEPEWPPLPHPLLPPNADIFEAISEAGTISLHHPFQSFDPVVRFLQAAAEDPDVLAIKQTLYRVSGDSPLVRMLQKAAENGKQVTVLVELKARFDEQRNIQWARRLEDSGAHVVYGLAGLKVHSKALMIVRRERGRIRRYVHLSTGNYNDKTARLYTDTALFLTDPGICADIAAMFNVLTGYSEPPKWKRTAIAPFTLRSTVLELIQREIRLTSPHNPGQITAKMNSLVDPEIIEQLYKAARAGVKIELVVRGICCLKPGLEGWENIRIVSIVDRFLEHTRVYRFRNNGNPEYYLSSADMMPRNLDRRIETFFPVDSRSIQEELDQLLKLQLNDTYKGRTLQRDGRYTTAGRGSVKKRSQALTYNYFKRKLTQAENPTSKRSLHVLQSPDGES